MVRVICIRHSSTARFKLTKLFGIYDFSVEKDSGKVLIIIIYCFYNYLFIYSFFWGEGGGGRAHLFCAVFLPSSQEKITKIVISFQGLKVACGTNLSVRFSHFTRWILCCALHFLVNSLLNSQQILSSKTC